jgi:hypothetical protein
MTNSLIAVCGLDCAACDIYRAPQCPEIAQRIADWLRDERGVECGADAIRCSTCRGERSACWSDDCWIRACCVDENKLDSCHRCPEFPCARLSEWSTGSERYGQALEHLRSMKEADCGVASSSRSASC